MLLAPERCSLRRTSATWPELRLGGATAVTVGADASPAGCLSSAPGAGNDLGLGRKGGRRSGLRYCSCMRAVVGDVGVRSAVVGTVDVVVTAVLPLFTPDVPGRPAWPDVCAAPAIEPPRSDNAPAIATTEVRRGLMREGKNPGAVRRLALRAVTLGPIIGSTTPASTATPTVDSWAQRVRG